ncbi:MAG TPA: DegT/DnrJ/EryC1/StrS family aminotransferase [Bacillota bacterium]|nr:DegT/DnrJ/EryC1/StrS family aminotransferase [Bacillota bacterium]
MIPISDPKRQLASIHAHILDRIETVLMSGDYILGPHVIELEKTIATRFGVSEAVAVASGTDALVLALEAFGIGHGDEVITTPLSFFATAEAITRVGATPVFADVDETTFNIDPQKVEQQITPLTKAILPVHLFGQPVSMDAIKQIAHESSLVVIEDACQAFGATYQGKPVGALGDAACFSFFPTKNLSTIGDGGIVTTSNHEVAAKIRQLRAHGSQRKYLHKEVGYNSRLDEVHAAILIACLEQLDDWNDQRRILADRYQRYLADLSFLKLPQSIRDVTHVYHLFNVQSNVRKAVKKHLAQHGVKTGIYYPRPLHLQEAYHELGYQKGDFPIAEYLSETLFALPLFPFLTFQEQNQVITALRCFEEVNGCFI